MREFIPSGENFRYESELGNTLENNTFKNLHERMKYCSRPESNLGNNTLVPGLCIESKIYI